MADDGANTAGSSEALESKIASALRIREAYLKEQAEYAIFLIFQLKFHLFVVLFVGRRSSICFTL